MKKLLFILPILLLVQNCSKQVRVKGGESSTNTSSPKTNANIKITSEWSKTTNSMSLVQGKTFRVDQSQGDYQKNDVFNFESYNQLQVSENNGEWLFYGNIQFATDGSFRMESMPSYGRIFILRDAYKSGTQTKLYYEFYENGSDTDSEYYDGYLTLISE